MLTCVRVRNFRGLRDLKVDEMARINLFAGFNNSGKTTLLEALFLLATASNPQKFSLTARGIESVAGHLESVADVLWKPMFSEFDASKRPFRNELSDSSRLWFTGCGNQPARHNMWTEITRAKYAREGACEEILAFRVKV